MLTVVSAPMINVPTETYGLAFFSLSFFFFTFYFSLSLPAAAAAAFRSILAARFPSRTRSWSIVCQPVSTCSSTPCCRCCCCRCFHLFFFFCLHQSPECWWCNERSTAVHYRKQLHPKEKWDTQYSRYAFGMSVTCVCVCANGEPIKRSNWL